MFREASTLATTPAVPSPLAVPLSHDAALHQAIGDPAGERVVIIGHHTLDVMCAVIRMGASEVTVLRLRERPEAQEADLAILLEPSSMHETTCGVMQARRALAPTGRIVVGALSALSTLEVSATLRAQGFSAVHARSDGEGGGVVSAELPFFGPLGYAHG